MNHIVNLGGQITVGPQPSAAELAKLRDDGCKTVINFRHEGEDELSLSPEDEGECVERLEMAYLHVPVSLKTLTPSQVNRFRQEFANVPLPVFAHCKAGRRAGLMLIMHLASQQRLSGKEALAKAESLGFHCDTQETKQFVIDYVESHCHARV